MNRQKETSQTHFHSKWFGYFFLFFLVVQSISILLNQLGVKKGLIGYQSIFWATVTGIIGGLYIWLNRVRLLKIEDRIWQIQQKRTQTQNKRFSKKYPILNRIPVLGFLYKKWQSEPFLYKLALIGLGILASGIYLYDLSYYDWLPDETLVTATAKGYLNTGTYTRWDFWTEEMGTKHYDRAWIHTWMVAQSFRFFGYSEWSARIVSVFLGLVFVPIIYGVSNFFLRNRLAALLVTFVCILNPYLIVYFRRTRMYALLMPTFTLLVYLSYRSLTNKKVYSTYIYEKYHWVRQYFNYDWSLVVATLFLLYAALVVQILSAIILLPLGLFLLYLSIFKKQKRLIPILLVGAIVVPCMIAIFPVFRTIANHIDTFTFFGVYKPPFTNYLYLPLLQTALSLSILSIGFIWIWISKYNARLVFIYMLVVIVMLLYTYSIDYSDNSGFRYVMHIMPFASMLVIGILFKINRLLTPKSLRLILPFIILILSTGHFINNYNWIYRIYPEAQFFTRAYPTILNNIQPEKEGLIGMFIQREYMIGWGHKITDLNIPKGRKYSLQWLKEDLSIFDANWVTWATHKSWHLRPEVIRYINKNCVKYHGYGVDNSMIEVFYCKQNKNEKD
ncbi:MAG: hypothetical protein R3E32_18270 [Chitinophagales bacterium]